MEEPVKKGTIDQWKGFLEGLVWKDITNEIDFLMWGIMQEFAECKDQDEIFRMQGRLEVLRDMKVFIPEILEALKADKDRDAVKQPNELEEPNAR